MTHTMEGQITQILKVVTHLSGSFDEFKTETLQRFNAIDSRLDVMEGRLDIMDRRLDAMEERLDVMDGRLDAMDSRFDTIEKRLDAIEGELRDMKKEMKTLKEQFNDIFEILMFLKDHAVHGDQYQIDAHNTDWRIKRIEKKLQLT